MEIEFDPTKEAANIANHDMTLAMAEAFEWSTDTTIVRQDTRKAYPEARFEATGYIGSRLCVLVFCNRHNATRIISLRKANKREIKRYAST